MTKIVTGHTFTVQQFCSKEYGYFSFALLNEKIIDEKSLKLGCKKKDFKCSPILVRSRQCCLSYFLMFLIVCLFTKNLLYNLFFGAKILKLFNRQFPLHAKGKIKNINLFKITQSITNQTHLPTEVSSLSPLEHSHSQILGLYTKFDGQLMHLNASLS